jgi:hypothetical protein
LLRAALAAAILSAAPHPDALRILDNVARHQGPAPVHAPALVRDLFARPMDAQDAAAIFARSVPAELARGLPEVASPRPFDDLLRRYLSELELLRTDLRAATDGVDPAPALRRLQEGLPSADQLLRIGEKVDQPALARVNARFIEATLRFAREARVATGFPHEPIRFQSAIGLVSIGSLGNDHHPAGAALIVDPGGDDVYERAPTTNGEVSVIVDLAGNDRYTGSDVVVQGLSAIVDFFGNDVYETGGAGLAGAIAGCSLIVDYLGNDRYRSERFGQGAAAFGFAALVDLEGDDLYVLGAWGQGFGAAGGVGLLWDQRGDDVYTASGEPDTLGRGAPLSGAQGAAFGFREMLGGGIGILRDGLGNDRYEAAMFAQGLGYWYGIGVLWDEHGDDRYKAVRYAQGAAAHEAIGVLRDERGDDKYELGFGVGQGMGLDAALGVLFDGAGDDEYRAPLIAQGTATANGLGILSDLAGMNRFEVRDAGSSWGEADDFSGLPSVGVFLVNERSQRIRTGQAPPAIKEPPCSPVDPEELKEDLRTLRRDYFDAVYAVGGELRCAIETGDDAQAVWKDVAALLERDPETPLGDAIAAAFRERPPLSELAAPILLALDRHPRCSVRAAALIALPRAEASRAALWSPCFRMQSAGLRALRALGIEPPRDAPLPAFLRTLPE